MTALCCPTCGQSLPDGLVPVEALVDAALTTQQMAVIELLIRAYPRSVTMAVIVDSLWGDDPNGGPEDPRNIVHIQLSRIRKMIRHHGWTIPKLKAGPNDRSGRYRLERIP